MIRSRQIGAQGKRRKSKYQRAWGILRKITGAGKVFQTPELLHGKKRKRQSAVSGNLGCKVATFTCIMQNLGTNFGFGLQVSKRRSKDSSLGQPTECKSRSSIKKARGTFSCFCLFVLFLFLFFNMLCLTIPAAEGMVSLAYGQPYFWIENSFINMKHTLQ